MMKKSREKTLGRGKAAVLRLPSPDTPVSGHLPCRTQVSWGEATDGLVTLFSAKFPMAAGEEQIITEPRASSS